MNIRNIQPVDCPDEKRLTWDDLTAHEKAMLIIYRLMNANPAYAATIMELSEDEVDDLENGTVDIIEMVEEGYELPEVMAYIERNYGL